MTTYTRRQPLPPRTFFLFGPRGTGKTTWLRQQLEDARWYNLLHEAQLLQMLREPAQLTREVEHLPKGSWVVIDEVQRAPALLDEVHDLISRRSDLRFALTGSSARKLRRGQGNLLAGRALTKQFFPLVASEFGTEVAIDELLSYGCLPAVCAEKNLSLRVELLEAYGQTYLTEEIRAEAVVKNLSSFVRFLEVAALMNGQVTNVSAIARDAAVARPTVQGYFDVLVDTLIGTWLPAYRPRAKVKEVAHPKFYFFDAGVVRCLSRRLREPLEAAERGPLFETYLLHELRAHINDTGCGGDLAYWRTPSGTEVDFIWSRGSQRTAIEAKATTRWRPEEARGLKEMIEQSPSTKAFAVYLGSVALKHDGIEVLPVKQFLQRLGKGEIL